MRIAPQQAVPDFVSGQEKAYGKAGCRSETARFFGNVGPSRQKALNESPLRSRKVLGRSCGDIFLLRLLRAFFECRRMHGSALMVR